MAQKLGVHLYELIKGTGEKGGVSENINFSEIYLKH